MFSTKKGQFYIFTAIILCVYAIMLVLPAARGPAESSFRGLADNYLFEYPKVVNSALYNQSSSASRLGNFTDTYVAFARSLDPRFGLVYGYRHDGVTDIRSRMWENINITYGRTSFLLKDGSAQINASRFTAYVSRRPYTFNLTGEVPIQVLFISRSDKGANIFKG